MSLTLPALTLPDPVVSGEGVLDPLGLSNLGDRLADELLPGLRARMGRVRFVTAIAVASSVVDGLQDRGAGDGVTTPELVFEWLLVLGFHRKGDRELHRRTPGIMKAADVVERRLNMSAKTYLKVPTVFGFHGVYKPLARDLEIVDDDLKLLENGRALLDEWEREQGLSGFLDRATPVDGVVKYRSHLRSAVEDALERGYLDLSPNWVGWQFFANHLQPSGIGPREAALLWKLLVRAEALFDSGQRPVRWQVLVRLAERRDAHRDWVDYMVERYL